MNLKQITGDLDILELKPDATAAEARAAYLHLKELYTEGSIATHPLDDEITGEKRKIILWNIEDAYSRILKHFSAQDNPLALSASAEAPKVVPEKPSYDGPFEGAVFKALREQRGASFKEVEAVTKVTSSYIEYIEMENYKELPEEVFVRGYVISYAKFLKLDHEQVAKEYMERYREWKQESTKGNIS